MGEPEEVREKSNGEFAEVSGKGRHNEGVSLDGVLRRVGAEIFFPNPDSAYGSSPVIHRIKASLSENVPLLRQASRNTGRDVLLWARRGTPLRALLVVSVGTIGLLALTGLVVFMLFFLAATVNAIIISLLVSLAAAGGFLALFFACVTAIYIGALSVAVFVISTATISAIIAVLIATRLRFHLHELLRYFPVVCFYAWLYMFDLVDSRVDLQNHCSAVQCSAVCAHTWLYLDRSANRLQLGRVLGDECLLLDWIGFFWTVWLATKKSVGLAKHSLTVTGSALSAYSSARHVRSRHEHDKVSD
ncbi:hypothetical protein ACSBR1_025093 [Camellia fascicularis]